MNFIEIFKKKKNKKIEAIKLALSAEVLNKNGLTKKSINLLNKAINFDKENDSFFYERALCLFKQKQYKKALSDINNALKINKNIYYYHLVKSDVCHFLNKNEEENESIQKAIKLFNKPHLYYEKRIEQSIQNENDKFTNLYKLRLKKLIEFENTLIQEITM